MDMVALSTEITPYITAAATAYGTAVVTRTQETAADATVGLGQRLIARLLGRTPGSEEDAEPNAGIEEALTDLAEAPGDTDLQAALRARIRKALAQDPGLAADLTALVRQAGPAVTASGERSVAVQHNTGIISTGDNATIQR